MRIMKKVRKVRRFKKGNKKLNEYLSNNNNNNNNLMK